MGQSAATFAMDSATPRRQKARVRRRAASGSAAITARIVRPENTVSSTTASDAWSATPSSWTGTSPGSVLTTRYPPQPSSSRVRPIRRMRGNQPVRVCRASATRCPAVPIPRASAKGSCSPWATTRSTCSPSVRIRTRSASRASSASRSRVRAAAGEPAPSRRATSSVRSSWTYRRRGVGCAYSAPSAALNAALRAPGRSSSRGPRAIARGRARHPPASPPRPRA